MVDSLIVDLGHHCGKGAEGEEWCVSRARVRRCVKEDTRDETEDVYSSRWTAGFPTAVEKLVGGAVENDPRGALGVVVEDQDDGVPPPAALVLGREQQASRLRLGQRVGPVAGRDASIGASGRYVRHHVVELPGALGVRVLLVHQRGAARMSDDGKTSDDDGKGNAAGISLSPLALSSSSLLTRE